eukprot:6560232-Alexandrium_andersonii.AAC.1
MVFIHSCSVLEECVFVHVEQELNHPLAMSPGQLSDIPGVRLEEMSDTWMPDQSCMREGQAGAAHMLAMICEVEQRIIGGTQIHLTKFRKRDAPCQVLR